VNDESVRFALKRRLQFSRQEGLMILELFCLAFVATFVALAVLGHVLLFSAIYSCWRDDGSIERFKSKPRLFELAFAIEGEALRRKWQLCQNKWERTL
jgi:hypothetical protein